jgi:predicted dehydrogenase
MADTLKLALVGCGAISAMHLIGLRDGAKRTQVTAVVDTDRAKAEAVAKQTGARVFTSIDDALRNGDFEAVDLMLPHDLHEEIACHCFAAGRHVLLEKPMAPTPDSCAHILETAARVGTVFMVAENAQYWPEVLTAKRMLDDGAIGEVVTARAAIFFPPMEMYYGGDRAWRMEKRSAGGGIAMDTGSHWIRPLRMWLGEVDEVVAALGRPFERMEGESLARALLRFESGAVAVFDALLTEGGIAPDSLFRITGKQGEITIDGMGRVKLYDGTDPKGQVVGEPGGYMRSYAGEMADFERAVLDRKPLDAGPESSLGELRTALAMVRSGESRRWEKVWE